MIVFVNLFKSISFMLRKKIKHRKLTEKNGRLQKLEDCFELKREHVSKKKVNILINKRMIKETIREDYYEHIRVEEE